MIIETKRNEKFRNISTIFKTLVFSRIKQVRTFLNSCEGIIYPRYLYLTIKINKSIKV